MIRAYNAEKIDLKSCVYSRDACVCSIMKGRFVHFSSYCYCSEHADVTNHVLLHGRMAHLKFVCHMCEVVYVNTNVRKLDRRCTHLRISALMSYGIIEDWSVINQNQSCVIRYIKLYVQKKTRTANRGSNRVSIRILIYWSSVQIQLNVQDPIASELVSVSNINRVIDSININLYLIKLSIYLITSITWFMRIFQNILFFFQNNFRIFVYHSCDTFF